LLVVLLVLALIGALIGWLLASRRRNQWAEQLDAATAEVAWVARTLVPQLQQQPAVEEVAGGWAVAVPRVVSAEDKLTELEASAPDTDQAARARTLRDALRAGRARIDATTQSQDLAAVHGELAGVTASLEEAMRQASPEPPAGG
jgi:hypothetical protein